MKTQYDIYYKFWQIAYEYKMCDSLTQPEIDELAAISENKTFCALCARYGQQLAKRRDREYRHNTPFYQQMRPTIVLMAAHLEQQSANCHSLRVRAIVGGYLRTMLDGMEYNANIYQWKFVNLINAFPNMSDEALAKYCVAHKIEIIDDRTKANDVNWLTQIFKQTRQYMNAPKATAPISQRESIFAERWIEIFERQK